MAAISPARAVGYAAGGSLIALGLARRSKTGLAMAAAGGGIVSAELLTHRDGGRQALVRRVITIGRPPEEIRNFFSAPVNVARIMPGIESIRQTGEGRWQWMTHSLQWETGLIDTNEDSHLHWRTAPGAPLRHEAHIHLRRAPGDRGTEVQLLLTWKGAGALLGHGLEWYSSEVLRRAKRLLETGELVTTSRLEPQRCL